jgi:putative ABC transport system permease protein
MATLIQDLRYGMRMLLKNPGVSAIAIITLALGIGANTAIFSIVDTVMLRPLPYRNPDRLVSLWENVPGKGQWRVTPANFLDWKSQNTVFENVSAFSGSTLTLTGDGEPEQILGLRASAGFFSVIGVEPVLGRSFVQEEFETGKDRAVILGHGLWQRRFGGNPAIINQTITLNGANYTVVGVMPPGTYPGWPTTAGHISFSQDQQQFWTPMTFTAQWAGNRTAHVLGTVGRLKPGISFAQATAEMNAIGARLEQAYPAANKGEGIIVNQFMNEVVGNVRPALFTLLGAVALVLLIACSNIAGLLLAQHASRSKEIAIRAALGAGRGRLVRQFFVEGLLLSLIGTGLGIAIAKFGVDAIIKLIPSQIPRLNQVTLDWRVLSFALLLSLLTCLLFASLPALHAVKPDLQSTLEQGGRSSGAGSGSLRFRQSLVVLQVGISVVLVVGAGLLIKSFWRLNQVDPGFRPERVLAVNLTLPHSKYPEAPLINNFYSQLTDDISRLPGVEGASIAYDQPLQANWVDSFTIEGRPAPAPGESYSGNFNPVSWDYFRTVGADVLSGRQFTALDDQAHPGVVIVNEEFVRRYFPNEQPLGQKLKLNPPARIWQNQRFTSFEVIGIARNVKSTGLAGVPEPAYYVPTVQAPLHDMTILVRTRSDPASIVPALRSAVWRIDPNQPIASVDTMDKLVAESIAQPRLNMLLMGLFGCLALMLAAVGIYGLLSYSVTQRTQEIGIRMALGARIPDILNLVLKRGVLLVLIGEVIGLAGAFVLTRLMRSMLFEVTPTDATTFIAVAAVLAAVAGVASYVPARRAARVDPLVALRYE